MIQIAPDATDAMSGIASTISVTGGDNSITEVIAILIPIVAIVFGIGIGMLSMYLDYRKKREFFQLHHKERLAAIDKGMEVPPLPAEFFQDPRRRPRANADYLRRGLVWLFVGVAIAVALYNRNERSALWGLVPAAAGLGNLIFYFVQGRQPRIPDDPSNPTR